MIQTYTTTVYDKMTNPDRVALVDEAVDLLLENTNCTLVSRETDMATYYDATVDAGGVGYRFRIPETSSSGEMSLTVYRGIFSQGAFVAVDSGRITRLGQRSGTYSQYAILRVINGGAIWSLRFRLYWKEGSFTGGYDYIQVRTTALVSGLTGEEVLTEHVDNNSSLIGYPSGDYALSSGGGLYVLQYTAQSNAKHNIPDGKILLFPSLILTGGVENGLGVPTIGGQLPYYMVVPNGVSLTPFTEFYCNGGRYISLGNVAIRSL